jgi:gliding motility-associated-like protein
MLGTAFGLFPFVLFGQNYNVDQQVVASTGGYDELADDLNITYTVGEMAVSTKSQNGYYLTEGFQQPNEGGLLLPALMIGTNITEAQCPQVHDGSLRIAPSGCQAPYTIELAGNGDTIVVTDITKPYTFMGLDSGDYRVTVRGFTLCSNRKSYRLDLKNNDCGVKYYTGITPNGDGKNDYWEIDNIEINQPNEVRIFNRQGQLVWSASNYDNYNVRWGGNNDNEQPLPNGTYFFTLEVTGNTEASKSGWIQLIK